MSASGLIADWAAVGSSLTLHRPNVLKRSYATGIVGGGDSIMAGGYSGSTPINRVAYLGGRQVAGNYAVGGKRADQMLTEQLPDMIASGASHALICIGTNDIINRTHALLKVDLASIHTGLRAGGVEPVDIGLLPAANAGNASKNAGHNAWRALYCAANGIKHVDVYSLLANSDGTGAFASGVAHDTVHPNSVSAKIIADATYEVLQADFKPVPVLALVDDRLFSSTPGLVGAIENSISFADTNADGVPNQFFSDGTAKADATFSIQNADADGFGKWARVTLPEMASFTASVSGAVMTVSAVASGTLRVGDAVVADGLLDGQTILNQLTGSAGSTGTYTISRTESTITSRAMKTGLADIVLGSTALTLSSLGYSIGDRVIVGYVVRTSQAAAHSLIMSHNLFGITAATGSSLFPMYRERSGEATGDTFIVQHECVIGSGTSIGMKWACSGIGYMEISRPILLNKTLMGL